MNLLLIRHGQTEENKDGIILGQNDGKLNSEGVNSAIKLQGELGRINVDAVYSSDLNRCIDTAQIALKNNSFIIKKDPRLREIDFGDYQGKEYSVINDDYITDLTVKFPGGESNSELIKRVVDFVNQIYLEHKNETVIVFSHSGPINTIIAAIKGLRYRDIINNKINHCEIVQLKIDHELNYIN